MSDASRALATYGTLAPGRANAEQLSGLRGTWTTGTVRGHLRDAGWGAEMGYPGLTLAEDAPEVAVHLFVSDDLAAHWARLDAFEGDGYARTEVQVQTAEGAVPAFIYQLAT